MTIVRKSLLVVGLTAVAWVAQSGTAMAVVGRPATPVSYAGVARRSTVKAATPGVAPVAPVATAAVVTAAVVTPGPGVNMGGPVNRVGVR